MIEIYHNPRCTKSRQGKAYLEQKGLEFKEIQYLKEGLTHAELKKVLKKLNLKPIDLVRTKEQIWKDEFKDQNLSDNDVLDALIRYPRLLERPIVIHGEKAVIARPTEKIDDLF